jgi:hypothetical protein
VVSPRNRAGGSYARPPKTGGCRAPSAAREASVARSVSPFRVPGPGRRIRPWGSRISTPALAKSPADGPRIGDNGGTHDDEGVSGLVQMDSSAVASGASLGWRWGSPRRRTCSRTVWRDPEALGELGDVHPTEVIDPQAALPPPGAADADAASRGEFEPSRPESCDPQGHVLPGQQIDEGGWSNVRSPPLHKIPGGVKFRYVGDTLASAPG